MTPTKNGRKNGRSQGGSLHAARAALWRGFQAKRADWAVYALCFFTLVAAVTKPPELRRYLNRDVDFTMPARENFQAELPFSTEDITLTKAKRDEAAQKVRDVYRVNSERVRRQLRIHNDHIQQLFGQRDRLQATLTAAIEKEGPGKDGAALLAREVTAFAEKIKAEKAFHDFPDVEILSIWLTPDPESLPVWSAPTDATAPQLVQPVVKPLRLQYGRDLQRLAEEGLEYVLSRGIIKELPQDSGGPQQATINIVREALVGDMKASEEVLLNAVPTPESAEGLLSERLTEQAKMTGSLNAATSVDWAKLQHAAFEMARPFLADTLFYDQVYTEAARERARQSIEPVTKVVQPSEVMQRFGDYWTPQSISDVKTYWATLQSQQQPRFRMLSVLAAHALLVLLVLGLLTRAVDYLTSWRARQQTGQNLRVALLIMVATVVLARLVSYFEPSGFVTPVAAGAILLAILVNARLAVMGGFLAALLVSVQYGYDWRLLVTLCAMCAGGVFGMYSVRRRSDMTRAALKATLTGLVAAAAVTLAMDSPNSSQAMRRLMLVAFNGGICLFIVPGVLSPLERLFRITTDIQLLEYSDLNNEVLSRLAIEVPATYSHCLMLGQLAEAAADSIGANGLLARVVSYYHDVGKLRRPGYFSENQIGSNIHDELSPRLSARAIASHVTCGVELAREYNLPKPIIDGIAQHHGTTLISFFYRKAVSQQKHDDVRVEDFRYPGPKPQTRETAIVMICDGVESGIRSIKNPNEERVSEFIDKIVTTRLLDRQFDECDLTLKDLDTIKEILIKRTVSSLHTRVAYPERKLDKPADNVVPLTGGGAS